MANAASERSLRDMAVVLREFEGVWSLWRVGGALVTYTLVRGLPIAAGVAVAILSVNGRVAEAITSGVVAVAVDALGSKLRLRFPWKAIVERRLFTFEAMNPATQVPVRVRAADGETASKALRHARFNPSAYGLRIGSVPPDAPDLDFEIAVQEPAAWPQSASDSDRVRRIAEVLRAAQVRARVAGIDVGVARGESRCGV